MSDNALRDSNAVTASLAKGQVDTTGTYNLVIDELTGGLLVAQAGTWTIVAVTSITNPVAVTGTFWQATQPVSLASVPTHAVTQSGTWNITDISGTISLPTGASTSANQLLDNKAATSIAEHIVTLTLANTEYSKLLDANTRAFEFQGRTDVDVRYAWTSGKVATPTENYYTLKAGMTYFKDNINLSSKTLYFASATAGTVVELLVFT